MTHVLDDIQDKPSGAGTILTATQAAEMAGVGLRTFHGYVAKGTAPQPDFRFGRTPGWSEALILTWLADRPGRGRRTDLELKRTRTPQ